MISGKLFAASGALLFAGVAAFGFATGRFKTREVKVAPYMRRNEHPITFWTYTVLLLFGAVLLAYVAIFVA